METAEPVSYDFPGHAGAFAHRRPMDSPLYPYYSHPTTAPYSLPYQTPTSAPYSFGSLSQPAHSYQYFVASQPPLSSPVRLTAEQPLPLPDIRPAKNAVKPVGKPTDGVCAPGGGPDCSDEKKQGADIEFSTGVDVLMKAIQAKPDSPSPPPMQHQSLPPLQQVAPLGYPSYQMSPPRRLLSSEAHVSRADKKRKYTCTLPDCGKSFSQKTHLDIHTRAHTGDKPFVSRARAKFL